MENNNLSIDFWMKHGEELIGREFAELRRVEQRIIALDRFHQIKDNRRDAISQLLLVRKELLDGMFGIKTTEDAELLNEFNDKLVASLTSLHKETVDIYNHLSDYLCSDDIEVLGRCFLGYDYPAKHPWQTAQSKQIWEILSGQIDNYDSQYCTDGINYGLRYNDKGGLSLNEWIYGSEELDNWNEHLPQQLTGHMHLSMAFNHLYEHTAFALVDLLWVREFRTEIQVDIQG